MIRTPAQAKRAARRLAERLYDDLCDRATVKHAFLAIRADDPEIYGEFIDRWVDLILEESES